MYYARMKYQRMREIMDIGDNDKGINIRKAANELIMKEDRQNGNL